MKSIKKESVTTLLMTSSIFIFSIFINRSITLDTHALGENLETYSKIFPDTQGILQPHRILLPLLGKVLSVDIQILNLVFYFLFILFMIQYLNDIKSYTNIILFIASLCTTMVMQFHLNFGGYPDILSYLLLLLAYIYRKEKNLPYFFLFLALLAKETSAFAFPFFFFLKKVSKVKMVSATLLYVPVYLYFSVGTYDSSFYLEPLRDDIFYWIRLNYDNILLGFFSSIKFLWIVIIYFCLKNFNKKAIPIYLLFLGILFQCIFLGDTTRFVSFMFLGVIYAFEYSNFKFSNFLYLSIIFLNIITPKYYVFAKNGKVNNLLLLNNNKVEVFDINVYFQYITYLITEIFT
tara:strand:- start:2875 stop:3918 length:1044 start_codon:yes stop_codon:yes gene_type:complete